MNPRFSVVVSARDSVSAVQAAENQNPGFSAFGCRQSIYGPGEWVVDLKRLGPEKDPEVREVTPNVGPEAPTVTNAAGGKESHTGRRMDLIPPRAILKVAEVLHHGAEKYGEDNWHKLSLATCLNHALIHVYAYQSGDRSDDHLGHAACRLLMALELSHGDLE